MTNNLTKEPDAQAQQWVQVAVLGGDVQQLDFVEGQTVAQALADAGVSVEQGQTVSVNGRPVTDLEQPLEPGSAVTVVGKIMNG